MLGLIGSASWDVGVMSKLQLSVAIGDYDRVRPLMDGAVQIDGVDPIFMNLPPEEIFFRAFRGGDFDICELSMSSFTVKTAQRNCPYVGVPAFVSRAFRHNAIYVRRDRIKSPEDLKGKRVGLPEFQLTACVWARIILQDAHGVKPSDITWVRGGIEHPGRPEKISIKLAPGIEIEEARDGTTISQLLARGEIDGFIAPRPPSLAPEGNPNIGWMFADPMAAGRDYFKQTGIFPIMHLTGIRRELVEKHPWLPGAVSRRWSNPRPSVLRRLKTPRQRRSRCLLSRSSCAQRRSSWDAISGRMDLLPTGMSWKNFSATIMRKGCPPVWSRPRRCFIPRRMKASRSDLRTPSLVIVRAKWTIQ